MKIIDAHAHIFIPEAFEDVPSKYSNDVPKITNLEKNHVKMKIGDKIINNLPLALFSVNDRLQQMNQENIDMQLLSMYPALFFYNLDAEEANLLIQKHNDAILNLTKDYKGYFMGLGTVPLQDVDKAIKELERIIKLGLVGVEVGSNVNGALLGESKFFPFFETAEKLNALLFVHPSNPIGSEKIKSFKLDVYVGNACDTTLAIASMMFNGMFDKFPKLKIYFAHGGGFLPYQIGRLNDAYLVEENIRKQIHNPPSYYLSKIFVDTVVYDFKALEFLVRQMPIENVLLGSDSPMDMLDKDIVNKIRQLEISEEKKEEILGKNVKKLLS